MLHIARLTVAAAAVTACACAWALEPPTPYHVGYYVGTAKQTYIDFSTSKKVTQTVPCTMYIRPSYNNIDLTLGSYSGTSHGSPLTPQAGGYFEGTTDGPAFTGIFSVKGTGAKTSIKGTFQYVNPYVIMSGKFSLKRLPVMS